VNSAIPLLMAPARNFQTILIVDLRTAFRFYSCGFAHAKLILEVRQSARNGRPPACFIHASHSHARIGLVGRVIGRNCSSGDCIVGGSLGRMLNPHQIRKCRHIDKYAGDRDHLEVFQPFRGAGSALGACAQAAKRLQPIAAYSVFD